MSELTANEATALMAAGMYASPPTEAQMKDGIERAESWLAAHNREVRAAAIADFVGEMSVRYRKHTGESILEDIALAIGYYGVEPEAIYGPSGLPDDSDFLLAQIERNRADRIESEARP